MPSVRSVSIVFISGIIARCHARCRRETGCDYNYLSLGLLRPPAGIVTSSNFTARGCYIDSHSAWYKTSVRPRAHAQSDRFERLASRGSGDCVNSHALGGARQIAVPFHGHVHPCSSSLLPWTIVKQRALGSASSRPGP